ncbi:MAG TPA: tetratricopeptide repeat protein [Terriglobales bacterium]|jgi:tetratricopeptide (TPR) repeat protein
MYFGQISRIGRSAENLRYAEAVPILEEVLKQESNTSIAYMQLGRAYVALKQYQNAIPPLRHVVETDNALAHYELRCALVKTGQWIEATPQFEAAVSQLNSSSMMHFYLALVYQQTSRNDEALTEFQSALRFDTKNSPANFLLGRMYVKRQQASAALPFLRETTKLRPDAIDPHRVLANAYAQLGQEENANRELSEAERIQIFRSDNRDRSQLIDHFRPGCGGEQFLGSGTTSHDADLNCEPPNYRA